MTNPPTGNMNGLQPLQSPPPSGLISPPPQNISNLNGSTLYYMQICKGNSNLGTQICSGSNDGY